jgi:hypothetical protein
LVLIESALRPLSVDIRGVQVLASIHRKYLRKRSRQRKEVGITSNSEREA